MSNEKTATEDRAWADPDNLPAHGGSGWALWRKGRAIAVASLEDVKADVRNWLPQNPLLVGRPDAKRFAPPVCIPELHALVSRNIARYYYTRLVVPMGVMAAVMVVLTAVSRDPGLLPLASMLIALTLTFALDYRLGLRRNDGVLERAMFFFWLRTARAGRVAFASWVAAAAAIGVGQLVLQSFAGGLTGAFHSYGVMYPAVEAGELWRFVTGPFLHYSFVHYGMNAFLLICVGTATGAMFGSVSVGVFLMGTTGGAFAQWFWGGRAYDNFGGMSGGVYALFALLVVAGLIDRRLLPKGFAVLCGGLALVGILSSELLNASAASVAHVAAFVLGGACAVGLHAWNARRYARARIRAE